MLTRVVVAAVLLAGTVAVGLVLNARNKAHKEEFEFAFTDLQDARDVDKAKTILMKWNTLGAVERIRTAMRIDLLFPFFYAPLLAMLCYYAAVHRPTHWVELLGRVLVVGMIVAGVCDLAENTTMLTMIGHESRANRLTYMLWCTWPKIILLVLGFLYIMLAHLDTPELPSPT